MTEQTQQLRSTAALIAAAANLADAVRAARRINRVPHNQVQPPQDPVNLNNLILACLSIHEITGSLGKVADHYAQAVLWPQSGYTGAFGEHMDYPGLVVDAAAYAARALTDLAKKLRAPAIGASTDAIASLDIALADWRVRNRRTGTSA
jgi:hypothetical protein